MHNGFVKACGRNLEYQLIPAHQINRSTLVLLHEGLGSVAMWRDFPVRLAAATGCRTLVYSRYGYGQSDVLEESFRPDFMHREAREALPELLAALDIENPLLVGHSDGASIALLHAGDCRNSVAGLVVMAPHCFVEDISIRSIEAAKCAFETTDLPAKLAQIQEGSYFSRCPIVNLEVLARFFAKVTGWSPAGDTCGVRRSGECRARP